MSAIRRALDAARKKKTSGEKPPGPGAKEAAPASWSGFFKGLAATPIEARAMERNKILPAIDDRGAIGAYKMLRTRVLQRMRANQWRSLIVTGAGPAEGKTLTACNLAISIANDVNQPVVLVDLDLQRPCLASYFGLNVKAGIGDYLIGKANIEDIVYAPRGIERLMIIPNRDPVPNSSELLASPRMRMLLDWLKASGGATVTVFDMPPVLACDDVLAFSPNVDAILLVIAEGATERTAVTRTMEMLGECNLLGVVLNRSREHNNVSPYY